MLLAWANATIASASVYRNVPSVGSVASHFIALPGVTELKCLVSSCACSPSSVGRLTAAPIGKYGASTDFTDGMSVWIGVAGTYDMLKSSMKNDGVPLAVSTYTVRNSTSVARV